MSQSKADHICLEAAAEAWAPEPELTVSEWADQHRWLMEKGASEPGPWRTYRTPYLREIMDALSSSSPVRRVVFMKGSRIGATECANNWLGYIMHHAPGPVLYVMPNLDMARDESKQRIADMIDTTPALRAIVAEPRSKNSNNTILRKDFKGGTLAFIGANSAAGFRRYTARYIYQDEVDGYPGDVHGEGDPIRLAERRASTFPFNRKILLTSSPGIRGRSRIEREYNLTDKRRYFIPCPECGHMDYLLWRSGGLLGSEGHHHHIGWDEGDPNSAYMVCSGCGAHIQEGKKTEMLAAGEWRATAKGDGESIGFHLSTLYSPVGWKSWAEIVREFLEAKSDPALLKPWVNTLLGESWEELEETTNASALLLRREIYETEIPFGVLALVAAIDVQKDRLELMVKGYGAGEESWLIAYHQEAGDPLLDPVWHAAHAFFMEGWVDAKGEVIAPLSIAVDTGYLPDRAYPFVHARRSLGYHAIKGGQTLARPLVGQFSSKNRYKLKLHSLCVDTGKETIYNRLGILERGPGFMHHPDWTDEHYFKMLLSEKPLTKYVKGKGSVRVWHEVYAENHPWDLEVYCLAALHILGEPKLRSLGIKPKKPERAGTGAPESANAQAPVPGQPPAQPRRPAPRQSPFTGFGGGDWVTGWKKKW